LGFGRGRECDTELLVLRFGYICSEVAAAATAAAAASPENFDEDDEDDDDATLLLELVPDTS
jgi:hypothetical protein